MRREVRFFFSKEGVFFYQERIEVFPLLLRGELQLAERQRGFALFASCERGVGFPRAGVFLLGVVHHYHHLRL